jgi:hypothetical protein
MTPWPHFTPSKGLSLVPIGKEAVWAPELIWTERLEKKYFASTGNQTLVIQSIVIYYTE